MRKISECENNMYTCSSRKEHDKTVILYVNIYDCYTLCNWSMSKLLFITVRSI